MSKPRICLINPPSAFLMDERVFVSLGILKVAAALEQAGYPVDMLDLSGIANYEEVIDEYIADGQATIVGLTATTPQLPAVMTIARRIRQLRPDIRLILGGPHVTLVSAAAKMEDCRHADSRGHRAMRQLEAAFDVLCAGDGERAILIAVRADSPPFLDGDDNKGPLFLSSQDFEDTPLPARHLVDMASYHYAIEGHNATSLVAQLGCPFSCGFCGGRNSKSLRVVRTRSVDSIMGEIDLLYRTYGYTGFMFYDDELNVTKTMVPLMNRLAEYQEKKGVEFRLRGFVKSELFTAEQAQAMYRAGFRWLLCGFEAASERILTNIDKRATLDHNSRAVQIAKTHGLKTKALMSIGHPGETAETALAIRDWLIANQVDEFDCTVITVYPGTPYYDRSRPLAGSDGVWTYVHKGTGDRLHSYDVDFTTTAEYYKGDPDGGYKSFVFTDFLSSTDIVGLRDTIERDVRAKLGIPFSPSRARDHFEHSMGQGLPAKILRSTS